MSSDQQFPPIVPLIRGELQRHADPEKAAEMQRYMKTDQPLYGVQKPLRKEIFAKARKSSPPSCHAGYEASVRTLWRGAFREEMYMALEVDEGIKSFHSEESWPMYEELVRTASHWDTLDWLAGRIISPLILRNATLRTASSPGPTRRTSGGAAPRCWRI